MATLTNNDSNKIKKLILKVKELAERGEKGERENAKVKLKELMDKYQMLKFDITNKPKSRTFKLVDFDDCRAIMTHCILDTRSNSKIEGDKRKKELYCELTDEQYVDVCEKFNHYYPDYFSQKDAFLKAYIIKNELGVCDEDMIEDSEDNDIDKIISNSKKITKNKYKSEKWKKLEV
jgi:hypothetical protein